MEKKNSPELTWLLKEHSVLRWRLIGPDFRNPFDAGSSDEKLQEYAGDRSALLSACRAQAYLDDSMVLQITDLSTLEFDSVHPNLVTLQRQDLESYLKTSGVWDHFIREFAKIRQACVDTINERQTPQ